MRPPHEQTAGSSHAATDRDLYEVLGVPRQASSKEIRRAYRALARKYHPDFNPGDATAAQRFRAVQEAYEVLSNPRKRKAYDYYGADFADRIPKRAPDVARQPSAASPSPGPQGRGASGATEPFPSAHPYTYRKPDIFPRLASRAQTASLATIGVFVFGTVLYLMLPDPGVREFQRAQEALRHVTSWKTEGHAASSDSGALDYLNEVSCPSSERTTRRFHGRPNLPDMTFGTVIIGYDSYAYTSIAKGWSHSVVAGGAAAQQCVSLQRGQDASGLPPLNQWLRNSTLIEKEDLRDTPEGKCREWKVLTAGGFSHYPESQYVCLGVKDHLPWFQGAPRSAGEIRFYDWNVPNEIVPPDLVPSP